MAGLGPDRRPAGRGAKANDFQDTTVTLHQTEKSKRNRKPSRWYELRGSLDRKPVYLMVEKIGRQQVAGYLFDKKGNKKYIYGEWTDNELQVYDQANNRLTIVLPEERRGQ